MDGVVRHATRAAGEVLLTAGLVGLLFIGYLIWGTGLRAASAQRALAGELNQQWQRPGGRGTSGARMYAWLWHRLPGGTPARAGVMALIILAVAAALWFFVFPWASLHLPIDTSGFGG